MKNSGRKLLKFQTKNQEVLAVVVDYFAEIGQLKQLIKKIEPDISRLVGNDTKLLVSARRGSSIGSQVIKNRSLCELPTLSMSSQKCGTPRCQSCQLLLDMGESLTVNDQVVTVRRNLNCKSQNVIYLAQCQICKRLIENAYFGQTGQHAHKRINGHRTYFTLDKNGNPDLKKLEKSALSLHCYNEHRENFSITNFKFILAKQTRPRGLDRSEFIHISEYRTRVLGLNRLDVQK